MSSNTPINVGFRSSNASCYNGGNPRNTLAPQPTPFFSHCLMLDKPALFEFSNAKSLQPIIDNHYNS
ncbi:hypothetical protein NIES22_33330 [Calothrix brevissima NIES-22]|nr:hypothetical protein NIES22_33330 [Calothrix brevissima NIES-22]